MIVAFVLFIDMPEQSLAPCQAICHIKADTSYSLSFQLGLHKLVSPQRNWVKYGNRLVYHWVHTYIKCQQQQQTVHL